MKDKLISKAEAAEMLGVSQKTLDRLAAAGKVPMYRIGGNCKFFEGEILNYIRGARVAPPVPTPKRGQKTATQPAKYVRGMAMV